MSADFKRLKGVFEWYAFQPSPLNFTVSLHGRQTTCDPHLLCGDLGYIIGMNIHSGLEGGN